MSVVDVVIGASTHYARAELVTLAIGDSAPGFVDRRTVPLIDADLPSAPYHHESLELDLDTAIELVMRVRQSVAEHARASISTMVAEHGAQALILEASPYDGLPDSLEEVLGSRALTNAADGMLYRESLAEAAVDHGLEVRRYPRKSDPMQLAAEAMRVDVAEVVSLIARFGQEAGAPWRKDHKQAAAAALSVLGQPARNKGGA